MKLERQTFRLLTALLGLTALFAGSANAAELFPADFGVVFPGSNAMQLVKQCRDVPAGITGTWTPDRKQIRELDEKLVPAFTKARRDWIVSVLKIEKRPVPADIGPPLTPYYRQYGGLVAGGRKIIYVNAFYPHGVNFWAGWQVRAISMCDGGDLFFGVEYDPVGKMFSHFEFSGTG